MPGQTSNTKKFTDSKRFFVLLAFLLYVLIGVPIWWFSTGAYQSLFPHDEIRTLLKDYDASQLHSLFPLVKVRIHIVQIDPMERTSEDEIRSFLPKDLHFLDGVEYWDTSSPISKTLSKTQFLTSNVRESKQVDDDILKALRDYAPKDLEQANTYQLVILIGKEDSNLYLGRYRHSWISSNLRQVKANLPKLTELYFNILTNRNTANSNVVKSNFDERGQVLSSNDLDDSDIAVSKSAMKYRISLTMVNMSPSKKYIFDWTRDRNRQQYENYIRSFTDSLSSLADFVIDWKSVMYGNLPKRNKGVQKLTSERSTLMQSSQSLFKYERSKVDSNSSNLVSQNQQYEYKEIEASTIQFLLNENHDWKFVSQDANETSIQFLVLIPSLENTPLLIRKYDGKISEHNSYVIPRWGGVLVFNPSKNIYRNNQTGIKTLEPEDMQYVMELFSAQLRKLFSIPPPPSSVVWTNSNGRMEEYKIKITYLPSTNNGLAEWESDQLIRHRIQNNLLKALETLKSMSTVVKNMPNVYVYDTVADMTRTSISHVEQALKLISNGLKDFTSMDHVLQFSKTALYNADRAFGHESMLSLLHFPDSQKLAIYLPLLLPVFVTILIGFRRERTIISEKNAAVNSQ